MAFASLKNGTHIDHQPFIIGVIPHHLQQLLPNAFIAPADKTAMRVAPVTQSRRQVTPGRTRAHDPEHGVSKQAIVFGNPTPCALASWQMRLKQPPARGAHDMAGGVRA